MQQSAIAFFFLASLARYALLAFISLVGATAAQAQNCHLSIANGLQYACDAINTNTSSDASINGLIQPQASSVKTNSSNEANHTLATVAANSTPTPQLIATSIPVITPTPIKLAPVTPITAEKSIPAPIVWEIKLQDITLAQTLQRWSQKAGWKLIWDVDKHLLIDSPHQLEGSFEEAVGLLLSTPSLAAAGIPLEVCFYPNTPPLARVTKKGQQDQECT